MARFTNKKGGWLKLWSKQWLNDEKLRQMGESGELAYLRILCVANALMSNGYFMGRLDEPYTIDLICSTARISEQSFESLIKNNLIVREDSYFRVKNWEKYQNNNVKYKNSLKEAQKVDKYQNKGYNAPKVKKQAIPDPSKMPV
jgi:hypothetical protein